MSDTREVMFVKAEPPRNSNAPYRLTDTLNIEYAVWEQAMWDQIRMQHMNQPLLIEAESKPSRDGRFTNHNLLSFTTNGAVPPQVPPVPLQAPWPYVGPPEPVSVAPVAPQTVSPAAAHWASDPDPKAHAIAKAVALKAAVDTLPSLEGKLSDPNQVLAIAEAWLAWLET
jgi:hypothetical protein